MPCVFSAFRNFANFRGRARRPEFWYFVLFNFIVGVAIDVLGGGLFSSYPPAEPLSMVYGLAVLMPEIAVGARRLHDTGRSGWWQLLYLVPIVGWIVLFIWMASPSENVPNGYGPA